MKHKLADFECDSQQTKNMISQLNFEETNQMYCWCVTNETMCRRVVYSTVYFREGVNCAQLNQTINFLCTSAT